MMYAEYSRFLRAGTFVVLTVFQTLLFSEYCAPSKPPPTIRVEHSVQVIPKQFPDGSPYYIIYEIPNYFPPDIPLYERGQVQKVFVYRERDMDIILRSVDSVDDIVEFYRSESDKRNWTVERSVTDPRADHQVITFPLSFENKSVETFEYSAVEGRIFAARRGNRVMVCRIIRAADSPYVFIIQQIRTEQ